MYGAGGTGVQHCPVSVVDPAWTGKLLGTLLVFAGTAAGRVHLDGAEPDAGKGSGPAAEEQPSGACLLRRTAGHRPPDGGSGHRPGGTGTERDLVPCLCEVDQSQVHGPLLLTVEAFHDQLFLTLPAVLFADSIF